MSVTTLVIGESGTGKSTSLRNLDPAETFVINVLGKSFPFRDSIKLCSPLSPDGKTGNYKTTDDYDAILRIIRQINKNRPEIKNLIIDDFNYLMCNEFMNKALIKGYDKFSEIAKNYWSVMNELSTLRADLHTFVLSHSDTDENGRSKPKTVGKMIDKAVCVEGMALIVLHSMIIDGKHQFLTQNNGQYMAKSPMGMFDDKLIDNDLAFVKKQINSYYHQEVIQ